MKLRFKLRQITHLLALGVLLGSLLYFRTQTNGGYSCSESIVDTLTQTVGEGTLDPRWESEQLIKARTLPPLERIDLYLDLLARGSGKAEAEVAVWLATDYQPGSLSSPERGRLAELVIKWPLASVRRVCAWILLREGELPDRSGAEEFIGKMPPMVARAWEEPGGIVPLCRDREVGKNLQALWLHRVIDRRGGKQGGGGVDSGGDGLTITGGVNGGEGRVLEQVLVQLAIKCGDLAPLPDWATGRALGASSLALLAVGAGDDPRVAGDELLSFFRGESREMVERISPQATLGLIHLATMYPEQREELVPVLISFLGECDSNTAVHVQVRQGVNTVLTTLCGQDYGDDVEQWERWWSQTEKRIRKYEKSRPGAPAGGEEQ